jgi:hypothetical protein
LPPHEGWLRRSKLDVRLAPTDPRVLTIGPRPAGFDPISPCTPKCPQGSSRRRYPVLATQLEAASPAFGRPRPPSADRASVPGSVASPRPPLPETTLSNSPEKQSPSRLCSADESVAPTGRCQPGRCPILPWVFVPLQGPAHSPPSVSGGSTSLSLSRPGSTSTQQAEYPAARAIPPGVHRSRARERAQRVPPESVRSAQSQGEPCRPSWGL